MKRIGMARRAGAALAALLLAGIALPSPGKAEEQPAVPLEEAIPLPEAAGGRLISLPLAEDPLLGPREEGYLPAGEDGTAEGYADPSVTVRVGRGRYAQTGYVYARVRIADPSQLRTLLASPLNSEKTVLGSTLAKHARAVVAINGDFCARQVRGTVIRQGETLRMNCNGRNDLLLIDDQGDLHILEKGVEDQILAYLDSTVQVFTFGPGLIVNGEPRYGHTDRSIATHKEAQRMAIAQTGPLEYLLITTEGPEDPGSRGLKLDQFTALLASFGCVQNAYNLDGGSCSTLIFRRGEENWAKINALSNSKRRQLKDIIYFADAWVPEGTGAAETAPAGLQEGD